MGRAVSEGWGAIFINIDQFVATALALLWQILGRLAFLGFPGWGLRDSWVVGFGRADYGRDLEIRS